MGEKVGLVTRDEMKFFVKLGAGEIKLGGIWGMAKPAVMLVLPPILDGLDNQVGDKIPEPWQTHIETLITMVYDAMQDKIITEQEQDEMIAYCAVVIDGKVDVPLLENEDEAKAFLFIFQGFASLVRSAIRKMKNKG